MKSAILVLGIGVLLLGTVLWALLDEDRAKDPSLAPVSPGERQRFVQPIVVGRTSLDTMVRVGVEDDESAKPLPPAPTRVSDDLGEGVRLAPARPVINVGAGARVVPQRVATRLGEGAQDVPGQPSDGRGEGARIVAAQTDDRLGEGARRVAASQVKTEEKIRLSYSGYEERFGTNLVKRARRPRRTDSNLVDEDETVASRNGTATQRGRFRVNTKQSTFVPHVPESFYADRTVWAPELQKLGVVSWSYHVLQISPHSYRVNAYFAFADGRNFPYSSTVQNAYPSAPRLVQGWLAQNEGEGGVHAPHQ